MNKIILLLVICAISSSCASSVGIIKSLNVCELYSSPRLYPGNTVVVEGVWATDYKGYVAIIGGECRRNGIEVLYKDGVPAGHDDLERLIAEERPISPNGIRVRVTGVLRGGENTELFFLSPLRIEIEQ